MPTTTKSPKKSRSQPVAVNNYINHVAMVLDGSSSMTRLADQIVKVADAQTAYLARRSQETNQETRVSLYTFNSDGDRRARIECRAYDKDALRLPSLEGLYDTDGGTPLIDATMKAIDDLEQTATLYGEHSFLIYVLTDGEENTSKNRPATLKCRIEALPDEWTLACFVPHQIGKREAVSFGFPKDNVAIWDANASGIAEVGEVIRRTSDAYFTMRSKGVRGTKNLFTMDVDALDKRSVKSTLNRLGPGQFRIYKITADVPVADFVEQKTKRAYKIGEAYYQLTVPVKVQANKQIALYCSKEHAVYTGDEARQLLSLPDYEVKVNPAATPEFDIFIQSTSVNRKLLAGTSLLIL